MTTILVIAVSNYVVFGSSLPEFLTNEKELLLSNLRTEVVLDS